MLTDFWFYSDLVGDILLSLFLIALYLTARRANVLENALEREKARSQAYEVVNDSLRTRIEGLQYDLSRYSRVEQRWDNPAVLTAEATIDEPRSSGL